MDASSKRLITVTYPQMERQDLTQGQLGHFKFTPVDDIRAQYQKKTAHLLQEQLAESLKGHYRLQNPSLPHQSQQELQSQHSHFERNRKAFKNSLTVSRRHIDLATHFNDHYMSMNPQKSRGYPGMEQFSDLMRPHAAPFIPRHLRDSSDFSSSLTGYPTSSSAAGNEDTNAVQYSLIKALAAEQESHEFTKAALKAEQLARASYENETQRLSAHNRSLVNSVNMLKSIIQNQVKKEQNAEADIPDHKTLEEGVARFKAEVQQEIADQLKLQKLTGCMIGAEYQSGCEGMHASDSQGRTPIPFNDTEASDQSVTANNQDIYNFDHFPGSKDSSNSATVLASHAAAPLFTDQLIDLTVDASGDPSSLPVSIAKASTPSINIQEATSPPMVFNSIGRDVSPQPRPQVQPQQVIQLPAEFLAKWKKPKTDHVREVEAKEQQDPSHPSNSLPNPVETKASINSKKPLQPDCGALKIRSTNTELLKLDSLTMAMPYSIRPDWKISPLNPVFVDEDEKVAHLGYATHHLNRNTPFWNDPVRYLPNKADRNIYRTVMIDFLPLGTSYKDVLAQIRGGALESIQLFEAIGCANDFMTVRVVFHYELDAQALYQYGQNTGVFVRNRRARVWQLLEPTYPKNQQLEQDVFDEGYTRLLLIDSPDNIDISAMLPDKLRVEIRAGSVISIDQDVDGLATVEFTSVAESAKAMRRFLGDPDFSGTSFDFEQDPCQGLY